MILISLLLLFTQPNVSHPRYRDGNAIRQILHNAAISRPDLFKLETLGFTQIHRFPILLLKVSRNPQVIKPVPKILLTAILHAEEVLGKEVLLEFIDLVKRSYGFDSLITKIVDGLEIYLMPEVNPDGHWVVYSLRDTSWRKNLRDNDEDGVIDIEDRCDGVDFNRNFDFNFTRGNPNPCVSYYRGPEPFSEPETRSIRDISYLYRFSVAVDYHSPSYSLGEVIYTPYRQTPDFIHFYNLGREFARRIRTRIIPSPCYGIQAGDTSEPGFMRHWLYKEIGTFAYLVEIASQLCQPSPDSVDLFVQDNLEGLLWLLEYILKGPSVNFWVLDEKSLLPLRAEIFIPSMDTFPTSPKLRKADIVGFHQRILLRGNYTFFVNHPGYKPETINIRVDTSRVDTVVFLKPDTAKISKPYEISPNVVKSFLDLTVFATKTEKLLVSVYDKLGRRTFSEEYQIYPGLNSLRLNFGRYLAGVYFVEVKIGNSRWREKIVKGGLR